MRGRVLGREPFPSTREVFAEVRREESRRQVMLGSSIPDATTNQGDITTAMMSSRSDSNQRFSRNKSDRPTCDYCNKLGHVKAKCWKLHGKPADSQSSQRPSQDNRGAYQASQTVSNEQGTESSLGHNFFNKEDLEQLYQLWTSHKLSSPSS